MLKTLRYNMKTIIWFLVFAFCFGTILLFSMDSFNSMSQPSRTAAVINGDEVPMSMYSRLFYNYEKTYREMYGESYEMAIKLLNLNIAKQTMNQIIRDTLVIQNAKELGIEVTDEEVIEKIKTYAMFQTNGEFDPKKWNYIVKNSRPDWATIEDNTRRDIYIDKMNRIIKNSVKVSDEEIYDFYVIKNEKAKAGFVMFDPADYIKDEDLKKYYDEHNDEFMQKKQYKARHILIKVAEKASDEAKADAKAKADELYQKIQNGGNFLKLALENSDDPGSKDKGGDLGYFSLGSMVKEFEDALVKLKETEVSPPVLSQFGYHIIKLESVKEEYLKPFESVKKQISSKILSDKEKEVAKNKANEFIAKAKESNFEKASKQFGLEFDTTAFFTRKASIPGKIGYEEKVSSAVFNLKQNNISEPVETNKGIYVLNLIEKTGINKDDFIKEKDRFKKMLIEEKQMSVLSEFYESLRKKAEIEILVEEAKDIPKAS